MFTAKATECVNEFDEPNSNTIYGKSKIAGEKMIQNFMTRFVIIRSSWVYDSNYGFVSKVVQQIKQGQEIFASDIERAIPTSINQLKELFKKFFSGNHYGIYHAVASGESCSRYELVKEIIDILHADPSLLHHTKDTGTKIVLDNLMMRLSEIKPLSDWKEELRKILTEGED